MKPNLMPVKDENGLTEYMLNTGLWETETGQKFKSDKDAWETLRKQLPNKFATLYKKFKVKCNVVNEEHYVSCNNRNFVDKFDIENKEYLNHSIFIPILKGITTDEYDVLNNVQ